MISCKDVVIVTVIGGAPEEYDFLLGALPHHLATGAQALVWETGAGPWPGRWPSRVVAQHRPCYGAAPDFDYGRALDDAAAFAREKMGAKVFIRVDADEYLPLNTYPAIEAARLGKAVRVGLLHHLNPWWGLHIQGQTRVAIWPLVGPAQLRHEPSSDLGIFHPVPVAGGPPEELMAGIRIQHLRFAIGRKAAHMPDYWRKDWFSGRLERVVDQWPAAFVRWRDEGRRPGEAA